MRCCVKWHRRAGAAARAHLVPDLAKGIAEQGAHHVNLKGAQLADLLIARVLQGRAREVQVERGRQWGWERALARAPGRGGSGASQVRARTE